MGSLYKSWILRILRDPLSLFWNILFPILLITLLSLTLNNVDKASMFNEKITLDYIKNDDEHIDNSINSIINNDEVKTKFIINISSNTSDSKEKLKNNKIDGYVYIEDNTLKVITSDDEFKSSMINSLFENFTNTYNIYYTLSMNNNGNINTTTYKDYLKSDSSMNIDNKESMLGHYALTVIAYTILLASVGINGLIQSTASYMSYTGQRIKVSSVSRMKLYISGILANATDGILSTLIVSSYIIFILKINLGINNYLLFIMASVITLITSMILGLFVTLIGPNNKNSNELLCISVVLIQYFLSGGMISEIKVIIDNNFPILNNINIASLYTKSINSVSILNNMNDYIQSILTISIIGLILLTLSILVSRGRKNELR